MADTDEDMPYDSLDDEIDDIDNLEKNSTAFDADLKSSKYGKKNLR